MVLCDKQCAVASNRKELSICAGFKAGGGEPIGQLYALGSFAVAVNVMEASCVGAVLGICYDKEVVFPKACGEGDCISSAQRFINLSDDSPVNI